ncbi:pyridoxal phosphate-dependent aminotransferase [Paradevosia shaoguanensis]|uniref:pyridoxal phosphate-dependent aminotransferase n=1 Tax=Paradevosia shaoguanensis TaxID=1335043 RepID=UPI003C715F11
MMSRPALTALAQSLPETVPFVGPEALERRSGRPFRARLGANESGFGPAPSVIAALAGATGDVWMYGDPENHDLRHALADHLAVAPENVMVGEGIDGLLGLVARLYLNPGDKVVTSLGAYPTFNFHVAGFGGQLVTVPYEADRESLSALAEAARRENARLVYLSNPDNPMGTWWPAAEVEAFATSLPDTTLLLLDEAYGETAPAGTLPPLDVTRPNILRFRTFSKAYGLAGLRCGYAIGEAQAIRAFDKVRNHFGVNRQAQVAALAALADQPYLEATLANIAAGRDTIAAIARDNGLTPIPSATNFITVDCGRDGAFAMAVLQALANRGVFIRKPMAPTLDRCIRISVGRPEEIAIFAKELPGALRDVR